MRAVRCIVERGSVGDENVVIAIAIVVENGDAVAGSLEDVFFVRASAIRIRYGEAGRRRDIDEVNAQIIQGEEHGDKRERGYPWSNPKEHYSQYLTAQCYLTERYKGAVPCRYAQYRQHATRLRCGSYSRRMVPGRVCTKSAL